MFPNLRLMVVAVLASILGISCALGLFAEFRVSHDSFLRESNAGTPLQLGSSDAAPGRVVNTAAPFEFRFQAPPPPAVVEALGSPETPDRAAVVQTTNAPTLESEPAANPAAAADAPATASDVAAEPAPAPASSDHATETPSPAATGSIAAQNGQSEAPQDGRQNAKPSAEGDLAARTPATPSAEEVRAKIRNRAGKPFGSSAGKAQAGGVTPPADNRAPDPANTVGCTGPGFHNFAAGLSMDPAIGDAIATTGTAARHHQADPPGPKACRPNHSAANHCLDDFAGNRR